MTAEEAVAYGLVDKVLESRKELPEAVREEIKDKDKGKDQKDKDKS